MTVSGIAARFDMAMPSISKHLSVLKDPGVVHERRPGRFVIYGVAADNLINIPYGFLAHFCPDAPRIAAEQEQDRRTV